MKTLTFGDVVFGINTMTYNQLDKSLKVNWAKQSRVNQHDLLQYTGIDSERITLSGVVFFAYEQSIDAIKKLNDMAKSAKPEFLIGLDGLVYGKWVLEKISENILSQAQINYSLSLLYYGTR